MTERCLRAQGNRKDKNYTRFFVHRRRFADSSEQEILALKISSEEDDARIYSGFAQQLQAEYPDSAALFADMADEEDAHRQQLIALHKTRFWALYR